MRSTLASTDLVRLLGGWTPVDSPAGMDFAERLSLWVGPLQAIALQSALASLRRAAPAATRGAAPRAAALAEDVQRVRAALANAIAQDPLPPAVPGADRARDAAYATYRQRHLELQRQMERLAEPLRDHVRQALGRASEPLRRLALLDAVMEQTLAPRLEALLPATAGLLERRYEHLRQAHRQALQEAGAADDPALWREAGGWLAQFEDDWRCALRAEADLRLEPVLGLVEALAHEDTEHTTP